MGADISATVFKCQQRRFWTGHPPTISVTDMPNSNRKAKPTAADQRAAERLRALWDRAIQESRQQPRSQWLTQETAAAALDVNQSAVSQYLNGLIPLNYRALVAFAQLLHVDPTVIRSDLPEQSIDRRIGEAVNHYLEWDDINGYAQAVGLGSGAEAEEYAETHRLKFRADSLRRKGLFANNLAVYYGRGDSMEPRIKDGDAILFDTSDTRPIDGQVYIVQLGRDIYAKRCEILDDIVFFRSDNPSGDHNWRKPRRMDNQRSPIHIIGRVRWIGSWEG